MIHSYLLDVSHAKFATTHEISLGRRSDSTRLGTTCCDSLLFPGPGQSVFPALSPEFAQNLG